MGPQRRVASDLPETPHVEPVIAVHPRDPDHLVAAAIVVEEPLTDAFWDSWTVHSLVSVDGGASWERRRLPGLERRFAGDPWLAWGGDGTLYLSCLVASEEADGRRRIRAWLYRSADGGRTWSEPERIPFAHGGSVDHPVLREMEGDLHVFATGGLPSIVVSRAPAGGDGFETLPEFRPDDHNNNLGSGVGFADGRFVFSSYDLSVPQPSTLWAIRSDGGGRTYERAPITTEHISLGFPMMAVDRSAGPRRDRIYAVWIRSFERPHVMLAYSDDHGASWSEPRRVHADSSSALRIAPTVAVGDGGEAAVVWIDGRHHDTTDRLREHLEDEGGVDCWDVYTTVSLDGGDTFAPEARLTPETTCANAPGNGAAGRRWRWGGDYIGVARDAEGGFHPIWADSRTGAYQPWTVRVQPR